MPICAAGKQIPFDGPCPHCGRNDDELCGENPDGGEVHARDCAIVNGKACDCDGSPLKLEVLAGAPDVIMPDLDEDFGLDDEEEDFEDDFDCMLGPDGQCLNAGSEDCDFMCPNRMSEDFAGSPAWRRKNGSACEQCGRGLADGEEAGHPRACRDCAKVGNAPDWAEHPKAVKVEG